MPRLPQLPREIEDYIVELAWVSEGFRRWRMNVTVLHIEILEAELNYINIFTSLVGLESEIRLDVAVRHREIRRLLDRAGERYFTLKQLI